MEELIQAVAPAIAELVAVVVLGLLAMAYRRFSELTGIQIEAKHREALHTAIETGVLAAIEKGPNWGKEQIIKAAVDHVRRSVPDAVKVLKPSDPVLHNLAGRYAKRAAKKVF